MKPLPVRRWPFIAPILALSILFCTSALAATVTLEPVQDATIFSEDGDTANGSGQFLFAGRTFGLFGSLVRRALLKFDLASIPVGATITGVTLTIEVDKLADAESYFYGLYKIQESWSEGPADPPLNEGKGDPAAAGDVTWTYREWNTVTWTVPGGNIAAVPDAAMSIGGLGPKNLTSTNMVATVQAWVEGAASNDGWLLKAENESPLRTTIRFGSREGSSPPTLRVDYTPATAAESVSLGGVKHLYRGD